MSNKLFLTASLIAAASAGSAFANEARVLDASPVAATQGQTYVTIGGSYDSVEAPAHGNGVIQFDFDAVNDVSPQFLQADIDGWNWSAGVARDVGNGWRLGMFVRRTGLEGHASATYDIPDGTPFRYGFLDGFEDGSGTYGGTGTADQDLDVEYDATFFTGVVGRSFGAVRGDVLVSIGDEESRYENVQYDFVFDELHVTNTDFDVSSVEVAARLATSFPLGPNFSADLAGSVGGAFRDIDMAVDTLRDTGSPDTSSLFVSDEDSALIGSVSGSIVWAVTQQSALSLNAGWTYDGAAPTYVAPDYAAGDPATIGTEEQNGYYVGVSWGRRW